jgi:hypothetical protein
MVSRAVDNRAPRAPNRRCVVVINVVRRRPALDLPRDGLARAGYHVIEEFFRLAAVLQAAQEAAHGARVLDDGVGERAGGPRR